MKAIAKRLRRLEDQFGPADGKPRFLLAVCNAGWGLALDRGTCIQILGEGGFLPSHGCSVVSFCDVPGGLNADELEQYLREHGAELRLDPATNFGVDTL